MINVKQIVQATLNSVQENIELVLNAYPQLKTMDDKFQLQLAIEEIFCKKNLNQVVKRFLFPEESLEDTKAYCEELGLDPDLVMDVFAELTLHKRMTATQMLNKFRSRFDTEDDCKSFFNTLVEKKMLNFKNGIFLVRKNAELSEDQQTLLDFCWSNPPMIVKPKQIKKTKSGYYRNGYLTLRRGIFSKKATAHTEVPIDFLNKQNAIPYRINYSAWDNYIKFHVEIPSRDPKEDDNSYDKKVQGALVQYIKKVMMIELLRVFGVETVYLPNMYDHRGRNYPIAYLINPQGQDLDKGLLSFEPRLVTKTGFKWLCISITNCFNAKINGVDADKCTFEEREQWFFDNIQPKMNLKYEAFIQWLNKIAEEADSPACFWSQTENMWWIQKNMREGNKAYVWAICHFDATSSGYQLQAIFAKDWEIADLTNLIDPESRKDLYSVLYNELIAHGIPNTYTRNQVKKKCFIPAVYNSVKSIQELFQQEEHQQIFNEVMQTYKMWRMNRLFPKMWNNQVTEYSFRYPDGFKVLHKITDNVKQASEFQGYEILFNYVIETPKKFSCELGPNITHGWDGYIARELSRAMSFGSQKKEWLKNLRQNKNEWLVNQSHEWTEEKQEERKNMKNLLALGERYNMYSLRILTEVSSVTIDLIPDEVFDDLFNNLPESFSWVSEIHDSFGVCPNQAEELMEQYRLNLYRLAKSKALPCVLEDYLGYYPQNFDFGRDDEFAEAIKHSVYALC